MLAYCKSLRCAAGGKSMGFRRRSRVRVDVRPRGSRACATLSTVLGSCLLAACASEAAGRRYEGHFDPAIWGEALHTQVHRTDRLIPNVILLSAIPVAFALDSDLEDTSPPDNLTTDESSAMNAIPLGLAGAALAFGAGTPGDEGRRFEVAAESLVATAAVTQVLKLAVGRERPDGESAASFPSGHTSFAFAGATLLVQDFQDIYGPDVSPFVYSLYLPAILVGVERVRDDRHWVSDVVVGAFLGVFLPNWIHDAHYAGPGEDRGTIYGSEHALTCRWTADVDDRGRPLVGIAIRF